MKIAHVSAHYPPNFVSGGTLIPAHLAQLMQSMGHEVSVYAGYLDESQEPYTTHEELVDHIAVHWINISRFTAHNDPKNWINPPVATDFAAWMERENPQVVHFHSLQTLGASLLEVAKRHGAKVVLTMHDFWWFCARQFLVEETGYPCSIVPELGVCNCASTHADLERRNKDIYQYLQHADKILAPSHKFAQALQANGLPPNSLAVDENGLTNLLHPREHQVDTAEKPLRFLYAGGSSVEKGSTVLLEALQLLPAAAQMSIDLYGFAHTPPSLPALAQARPAFAPTQLPDILHSHDVLILPSVAKESFSLIAREALSAGLPVITSDSLGPEEVVHDGINGIVVPSGDAAALAGAMQLLANDREFLSRLASHTGKVTFRTETEQASGLIEIYQQLMAPHTKQNTPEYRSKLALPPDCPQQVLFIIGIQGAPLRYRTHLAVEALGKYGVSAKIRHYRDPQLMQDLQNADAVVLYRVPATIQLADLIAELKHKRPQVPLLFDVDDLIFDLDQRGKVKALDSLSAEEQELWWHGVARYRSTMEMADAYVGSTEILCQRAHELTGMPTFRFPNGVGVLLGQASDRAWRTRSPRGDSQRFGYFSGTTTHNEDWAFIEPAVIRVLETHPKAELWLGGLLEPTPELAKYSARIKRLPMVPWYELPSLLAQIDVCLAPLTPGSVFNESKSAIKWLEAALVGTPTIASATQPFCEAIHDGETGVLARSVEDWYRELSCLLDDPLRRETMGARARRDALLEYSPAQQGKRYLNLLQETARIVREQGHRESTWEPVLDDEPLDAGACYVEPYEVPACAGKEGATPSATLPASSRWHRLVTKLRIAYQQGGIPMIARKTWRKIRQKLRS